MLPFGFTCRFPANVTPSRVPLVLRYFEVLPLAVASVPPVTVPTMSMFPVVLFSVSVLPAFVSVPVRRVAPPVPTRLPRPEVAKLPPRLSVPLATFNVPLFVQFPARLIVPPFERTTPLAVFVQSVTYRLIVDEPSACIVPWLIKVFR